MAEHHDSERELREPELDPTRPAENPDGDSAAEPRDPTAGGSAGTAANPATDPTRPTGR